MVIVIYNRRCVCNCERAGLVHLTPQQPWSSGAARLWVPDAGDADDNVGCTAAPRTSSKDTGAQCHPAASPDVSPAQGSCGCLCVVAAAWLCLVSFSCSRI